MTDSSERLTVVSCCLYSPTACVSALTPYVASGFSRTSFNCA